MQTTYLYQPLKTKKALKEAVKEGRKLEVYAPNPYGMYNVPPDGDHTICGPGPYDRKWYAGITVEEGVITKVRH